MSLNRTLIDVIIRQTDYTEEKAIEKLTEHKNDVIAIVREYMGVVKPPTRNEVVKSSTNQQIFSEIRNLMDDAAKTYQAKKAYEKRKEEYIAYMQAKQQEQAKQKESACVAADTSACVAADTSACVAADTSTTALASTNAVASTNSVEANVVALEEAVIAVL
jgi:hypothetical protein